MTEPNTKGHVHPVHAETLSQYINRQLGCTAKEFADAMGRDRGTVRNWWRNNDPVLWAAVAGCKAMTAPVGRVTRLGGRYGPCVVSQHLLEALVEEAREGARTFAFLAEHLEGRMGDSALADLQTRARDLEETALEIGYETD